MTIEMLFTMVAAIGALTGICVNLWTTHRRGVEDATEKRGKAATMEVKLDLIYDKVRDIEAEMKSAGKSSVDHEIQLADHEKRLQSLEKEAGG